MTAYGLQGLDWTGMKFVLFARIVVTSLDLQWSSVSFSSDIVNLVGHCFVFPPILWPPRTARDALKYVFLILGHCYRVNRIGRRLLWNRVSRLSKLGALERNRHLPTAWRLFDLVLFLGYKCFLTDVWLREGNFVFHENSTVKPTDIVFLSFPPISATISYCPWQYLNGHFWLSTIAI